MDPTIKLLSDLVSIDSVNPSLVKGGAGEGKIALAIAKEMSSIGLRVEMTEVAPGRPNVVGVLEGRAAGRSLMFCGHIDTVGVTGMAAPFDPVITNGRLYGRGSQDMKGGVAAMMGAARKLTERGGLLAGKLIIAAVADEEYESIGADALARKWHADAAVVTEPTDLAVAVEHLGFSWVKVTTTGCAAHGSRPLEGRDAILRMGRVLSQLEALDGEIQRMPPYSRQGTGSLHASLIEGGRELSSYPDRCILSLERRTTSRDVKHVALREVEGILRTLRREDQEFEASAELLFERPAFECPADHEIVNLLLKSVQSSGRTARMGSVSFWTDAAVLAAAGIPTVVFGPGGAGLHSLTEYACVEDVLACRDILAELALSFCR
jgi:acetylornithine deacetylase